MTRRHAGFSLIEVVVVLMISSVVVGFIATVITVPAQAHITQARRSELTASAESVAHWMSRDVRRALPHSLRTGVVGGRAAVEMIGFTDIAIYRDAGTEGDPLEISPAPLPTDDRFDVLRPLSVATTAVVVNNLGTPGQNAYELANVIANANMAAGSSTITLSDSSFRFAGGSSRRRVFLVSPANAITRYECDPAAGTLRRYDNLPITGNSAIAALAGGTPSRLISRDVVACTFTPQAAGPRDGGMLLMQVTLSRVTNGATETLRVFRQLKVEEVR